MNLTHRQKQVVSGIAASYTAKEIAFALDLSENAVGFHIAKAKRLIVESGEIGTCGSETDALFTHYALKHKLITLLPSLTFLGRVLVSSEVDYCYLTDSDRIDSDEDTCRRPPRNKGRSTRLGQRAAKARRLVCVLHHKRKPTDKSMAPARSHHQSRGYQRRGSTGLHQLSRSRRVLFHNDGK